MAKDQRDITTDRIARAIADADKRTASGEWRQDHEVITEARGGWKVWAWVSGVGVPAALAVAVWAHTTLWGHETRIVTLEAKRTADDVQTAALEARFKEAMAQAETRSDRQFEILRAEIRRVLDAVERRP